jgi:hypothetical protein
LFLLLRTQLADNFEPGGTPLVAFAETVKKVLPLTLFYETRYLFPCRCAHFFLLSVKAVAFTTAKMHPCCHTPEDAPRPGGARLLLAFHIGIQKDTENWTAVIPPRALPTLQVGF